MATIADIRRQYPQYSDLSDEQLARGFHSKFYNDMPYEEFASKIGVGPRSAATPTPAPETPAPQAAPQAAPKPTPFAGDQTAAAMSAYGFGDTFKGLGTTIAERIKQLGYGYVLNRADEAAKLFEGTEGDDRQKLAAVTNEYLQKLKESDARVQAATPQDLNMLEQGIRSAIESIAVATPGLAASFATKSPYPAVAAAGLQTKFGSYGSARAEGLDPRQAELYANIDGALEAATEFLPTEFLMKSFGAKSLKGVKQELVKFALGEGLGEQVATATQSLNAYANGLDKELEQAKDWKEVAQIQAQRQAVTALATIVTGGVFAGAAAGVGKYQERAASKQAEEDRRVADVAATYRRGAEQVPLGERPEEIPTRIAPPVAPEAEAVTTPTVPETEVAAPTAPVEPAVPQGTASIEDLLGLADEEGPPEYTDADVPAFVRGETKVEEPTGKAQRIQESAGSGVALQYPDYGSFLNAALQTGMSEKDIAEITGVRNEQDFLDLREQEIGQFVEAPAQDALRRVYEKGGQPYSSNAFGPGRKGVEYIDAEGAQQFEPLKPSAEKKAPKPQLPDLEQVNAPVTEVPPAEDLVQRSALAQTEVPSELAGPSTEETIGGAGVRGTELPVSRPGAEGRSVEEPAGAGVGLPPSDTTRAVARTEAAKPPLKKKSMGIVGEESPEALESLRRAEQDEDIPVTYADDIVTPEWTEAPNGFAYRQYKIIYRDTGRVSPVQEIRAPIDPTSKQEPAVIRRGLDSNGNPFGEMEATGYLEDVLSGKSFDDFNKYFEKPTQPTQIGLFSITPQNVADVWANPAFAPRAPGFKPRVKQIVGQARDGVISAEQAVNQIGTLADTTQTRERAPVVRDVAHFKARLTQALRQGRINQATHDLTQWLISKNPNLIEGLGLSISTRDPSGKRIPLGVQGLYSVVQDIVTLVPRANSDVTLVHEILHRAERMMPRDIQAQIRKIWERQLFANLRTAEMRGNVFEKDFYNRLVEYHFGDANKPEDLQALQDMIKTGAVPAESYQFMNPSEFWAVNASRIMQNRFKASPTFIARLKQWLKEFVDRIKGAMDLPSDAPFLRAMDKVMKGKGEFISPTIYGDNRLYNIDRQTRYKGWKSPERQYRDGEELILKRAERNRDIQKPPSPDEVIKQSLTKEAYEKFVESAANILRPWKREQKRLENEGKLILLGPGANDVYGILSQVTGIARWYSNMYVTPVERSLYSAVSDYAKEKGIAPEDAMEFFAQFRQAMSADLRRDELYRRYKPLKTEAIVTLRNGKKASPAALRRQLYSKAAELLGNQEVPREQKLKMLDDIRSHLDAIVSNKNYEDPFGDSMHPNRPVDENGNNLEMSTNWDAAFYSPAEGNDPILHTGPTLQVMEQDLQQYPSLRKAMAEFNKLQDVTKDLKRLGGVWNEYMDDVSHFYGWGDGYSPLMMEKEDSPLNLEGTRNSGDVATFVPGMRGGNHRVANVVYQSLSNAYRAASIAARGPVTERIANLIDTKQIPGEHTIDISPREQFMLALNNQPVPTDVMGGNVIIHTLPDGTKSVYRMDDTTERGKKLLDGVRRVNENVNPVIHMLTKAQGVIASQFTRLRAPFAPAQFVMDSMTLAPIISAEYGYRFGPEFLATATANLATLKGPKLPKLLRLYREGNEAALREYAKSDPFLTDVLDYIKEGGPSAYAEAYRIEKGLDNYVDKIKKNPFVSTTEGFTNLVDNWTESWDLLSRVSAMGVFKRRELERLGYADAVEKSGANSPQAKKVMDAAVKRAVNQAKELSNFNLHGNLISRGIAGFYMFWRPNLTTAVATADMLSKGFEDPQARIGRELSPEAQRDTELVNQKLKEFEQQRVRVRAIALVMMGAGMALYELARAMSDYDDEGRNKVAISDKGQWIRAAQFRIPGTDWNFNAMFGFGPGGFMAMGAQVSALLHGDQTIGEFSKNTLDTIISMFTPITPSQISITENFFDWFLTTFSPWFMKPMVEYSINRTSVDTAIYNAHPSRFSEIYSGGKNVPDVYKDLSAALWELNGEEVAPNKLYFFATHFAQAANDIVSSGYDIVNVLRGRKEAGDINWKPLLGSFVSRTGNVDSRKYYELQPMIQEAVHRVSDIEINGERARERLQPHDLEVVDIYKKINPRIQQLNGFRNTLNRSNLPPDQKKQRVEAVEAELNRLMRIAVAEIKKVQLTKQVSKP